MSAGLEFADPAPSRQALWLERYFNLYMRLLAVVFFVFAITIWLQAIGYWDGPNNRFDTMTRNWKIYAALMLVLFPVVSVGLWSTMLWGRVVWLMAAFSQSIALLRIGQQIGNDEWFLLFNFVTVGIYLLFLLALYFINKER